jgi:cyclopropane fatty-acyl-phospholipid synthase-like methyltransferase
MKVDYGLDAPGVVRGFAIAGALLAVATVVLIAAGLPVAPELFGLAAVMLLATVAAMIHSSRRGKLLERDRLLDGLGLSGDEDVLDVGCGRGLLLIGAAKRLPGGRAVGVDLWSARDQSGNRRAATLANAEAEGVAERVEVVDGDMRALPFADASFDAVVSNDAMCHIADRPSALRDWYRVLKPGGRALFTDAMVVTGPVSHEELATRSSIGFYLFVPPGANEAMLRDAGFTVREVRDVTANAADVATRWMDARARHRDALIAREGQANFDGLQRFLACVRTLSVERRLSRFAYLADKPARG